MSFKTLFLIFFYVGIVMLIVGILAKLIGFEIFGLKPISYLRFCGICALYSISSILAFNFMKKE